MKRWHVFPGLFFLVLVFFFASGLKQEPSKLPSVQIGRAIPFFDLPKLNLEENDLAKPIKKNRQNSLQANLHNQLKSDRFTSDLLKGQIALLNVWASWCAACEVEQEFLIQLSNKGIPIYGLNYKDNREDAMSWIQRWGNPYQAVGLDKAGSIAIDLGVYGTPETFLIDKEGIIRLRHPGVLNAAIWNKTFLPLIQSLEKGQQL